MQKIIAGALVALFSLSTPDGCGGSNPSGDLNHPDVKPAPYGRDNPSPQPKTKTTADTRKTHRVTYTFIGGIEDLPTEPKVTITWSLDNRGGNLQTRAGKWEQTVEAKDGQVAKLTVEQDEAGQFTQCSIAIDGKIRLPQPGSGHNPYMHRNDAGDCKVSAVVR